jgi:plasmid stabilization system protein ParE
MTLRILDDAEADLHAGYVFYKQESGDVAVASYFLDPLYSEIDSLRIYRGIHRKQFGAFRLLSKRFPFSVYYDVVGDEVQVLHVLDSRRDSEWIREQLR